MTGMRVSAGSHTAGSNLQGRGRRFEPDCVHQREGPHFGEYGAFDIFWALFSSGGSGQNDAAGGGSAGTGMAGAPSTIAGPIWRARGTPIPPTVDPGGSRADAARGVQVVRTVARSTWTPRTTPAPHALG